MYLVENGWCGPKIGTSAAAMIASGSLPAGGCANSRSAASATDPEEAAASAAASDSWHGTRG
eukprot:9336789-Alexandrium_andersonii.AAC.1